MNVKTYQTTSKQIKEPLQDRTSLISDVSLAAMLLLLGVLLLFCGAQAQPSWNGTADFSSSGLSRALAALAVSAGLLIVSWWLLGFLAAFCSAVAWANGYRRLASHSSRLSPIFMRRLVATILGINLLVISAASVSVATAAESDPAWSTDQSSQATQSPTEDLVDPAWRAEPPGVRPGLLLPAPSRAPLADFSPFEVVRPGDCLWAIAARTLGPLASDAEIAHEWPRWYATNRELIGNDPNLLTPGTLLQTPPQS